MTNGRQVEWFPVSQDRKTQNQVAAIITIREIQKMAHLCKLCRELHPGDRLAIARAILPEGWILTQVE